MASFTTQHKGLENDTGANNCFLNVVLQSFYQLYTFRSKFLHQNTDESHRHFLTQDFCLNCEIKVTFTQALLLNYEYGHQKTLSPENIRRALEKIYEQEHRFDTQEVKAKQMACAVEAFEAIIDYLHKEEVKQQSENIDSESDLSEIGCSPKCISHNIFGLEQCLQTICDCKNSGDIQSPSLEMLQRLYTAELLTIYGEQANANFSQCIGTALKETLQRQQNRICDICGGIQEILKLCIQAPKCLAISLTWADQRSQILEQFMRIMEPAINLNSVFYTQQSHTQMRYIFKGMICFYSGHYMAYFYSITGNRWIQLDDNMVNFVESWEEVKRKIIRGHQTPLLLFYESAVEWDKYKRNIQLECIGNMNDLPFTLKDPSNYFTRWSECPNVDLGGFFMECHRDLQN